MRVRLFASLREAVGQEAVDLEVPDACSVNALLKTFHAAYPKAQGMGPVLVAVNQEIGQDDTAVQAGDEVALLPPVSGGGLDRVVEADFDVEGVLRTLQQPEEGATVLFFGSVRDATEGRAVKRLHYEVYREMAESTLRRIEEEVRQAYHVRRVLVIHRVGDLPPGEKTILVAAVGRHRHEAFDACREALDRAKAEAPIWKKEVYVDGEAWVRHEHAEPRVRE